MLWVVLYVAVVAPLKISFVQVRPPGSDCRVEGTLLQNDWDYSGLRLPVGTPPVPLVVRCELEARDCCVKTGSFHPQQPHPDTCPTPSSQLASLLSLHILDWIVTSFLALDVIVNFRYAPFRLSGRW